MPGEMARSAARQPFGLPKVTAAASAASLSCQNDGKTQKFMPVGESSGEYRLKRLAARENAEALRARIMRHIASEAKSELVDIRILQTSILGCRALSSPF
jgi:hypothetical protein